MATSIGGVPRFIPGGMSAPSIDAGMVSFPDMPMPPTQGAVSLDYGIPGVQPFNFDFASETQKAYEQLKPYYEHLLSFSGGRLDLAKRALQYSYEQGLRETRQEHEQQTGEMDIMFPAEQEQLGTGLNRRGMIASGIADTQRGRLDESQSLRRLAVDRALADRESRLGAEKGFGVEGAYRDFEQDRFGLERDRQNEAKGMAQDRHSIRSAGYSAQLQRAQQEEMRRVQQAQTQAMQQVHQQPSVTAAPPPRRTSSVPTANFTNARTGQSQMVTPTGQPMRQVDLARSWAQQIAAMR